MLDEGIDPRKAGIVKRGSARTEPPVRHAPGPVSQAASTQPATATAAHAVSNAVTRPTDLSDHQDDIPKDTHSVRFLATSSITGT